MAATKHKRSRPNKKLVPIEALEQAVLAMSLSLDAINQMAPRCSVCGGAAELESHGICVQGELTDALIELGYSHLVPPSEIDRLRAQEVSHPPSPTAGATAEGVGEYVN